MNAKAGTSRINRFPAWMVPAFLFALLINALLFLLLPMLSQIRTPTLDMTEPVSVNLVRVREEEPPPPEEVEVKMPEQPQPRSVPEVFQPDLVTPKVASPDMPAIRFEWNTQLVGTADLGIRLVYEATELDQRPDPLVKIEPVYPFKAKRQGVEGTVTAEVLVDETGNVKEVTILEASPEGFFEESVKSVLLRWKFPPGKIMGETVPSYRVKVPIRFTLRD